VLDGVDALRLAAELNGSTAVIEVLLAGWRRPNCCIVMRALA
jgi:hypothetical protein